MKPVAFAAFVLAVLAGCSSSSGTASRPADPMETPPTTADPGAVLDQPNTPVSPPPERGGAGSASGGPGGASGGATGQQADGASCLASVECVSGVCEGPGCGDATPGTCAPRSRACTRDLRQYCGCDGKTFQSSGSCPGQRFASPGACP